MPKQKLTPHFAICINTDDPDLLTPRTIYEILPDESATKSNHVRVIDNEGEDYLYPADYFVFVDFPQAIQRMLLQVSHPYLQGACSTHLKRTHIISAKKSPVRFRKKIKNIGA